MAGFAADTKSAAELTFTVGETVLSFHGPLMYNAKLMKKRVATRDGRPVVEFLAHYLGWKKKWDEWLSAGRMFKPTAANVALQQRLLGEHEEATRPKRPAPKKNSNSSSGAAASAGNAAANPVATSREGSPEPKRVKITGVVATASSAQYTSQRKPVTGLATGPSVSECAVTLSPALRDVLLDDFHFICNDAKICPLPRHPTVAQLLEQYGAETRSDAAAELRALFDASLGSCLLYTFEREQVVLNGRCNSALSPRQYLDRLVADPGLVPSGLYGAEHLLRFCVNTPRLLLQGALERAPTARVVAQIRALVLFLDAHRATIFVRDYDNAEPSYFRCAHVV